MRYIHEALLQLETKRFCHGGLRDEASSPDSCQTSKYAIVVLFCSIDRRVCMFDMSSLQRIAAATPSSMAMSHLSRRQSSIQCSGKAVISTQSFFGSRARPARRLQVEWLDLLQVLQHPTCLALYCLGRSA
jgi:hypothetical protein